MKNDLNIKALTFDTGGTILDWHSGFKEGFKNIENALSKIFLKISLCTVIKSLSEQL